MTFTGFETKDFDTFQIDGLDARMEAIQSRIQPKFQELGAELTEYLTEQLNNEMFLHIAKHARRSVNPPNDTWLAIAGNKRGYKKHPHFQVGLFDDHVFIWLALIYELPEKKEIAELYLQEMNEFKNLPDDFVVSMDHTKKDAFKTADLTENHLKRFRDIKKAEFLVGRQIGAEKTAAMDAEDFIALTKQTFEKLIPYYKLAVSEK
ncbi:YktB family protein [Sediminibacillus massiliensis]|uniref:YktB family protein n=1 Tax=Sediminibacillus massiliensis TaxID=1926277 RepID=UPI000988680E|nr:DUF1054 domain-containing protein [Sediminibacillus massiliensis]